MRETRIFARGDGPRQWLAYSMHLEATRELAMILPLPVAVQHAADAVRFIDLSEYPGLFIDIEASFPQLPFDDNVHDDLLNDDEAPPLLRVHAVGSFVASYVPGLADFSRLDRRFRLSDAIWSQLPMYADWGFAVIQLQAGAQHVHPIALDFARRWTDRLYFPTTHVHDGTVHEQAVFDHMLYYQGLPGAKRGGAASERTGWTRALHPPGLHVDIPRTRGVVDHELGFERLRLHGLRTNQDTWLTPGDRAL